MRHNANYIDKARTTQCVGFQHCLLPNRSVSLSYCLEMRMSAAGNAPAGASGRNGPPAHQLCCYSSANPGMSMGPLTVSCLPMPHATEPRANRSSSLTTAPWPPLPPRRAPRRPAHGGWKEGSLMLKGIVVVLRRCTQCMHDLHG